MLSARSDCGRDTELRLRGPVVRMLHELMHAMGQPLTTLQMARALGRKGGADAKSGELLGEMAKQVESVTGIYRALRLLIEASEGEAEVTELGAMVRRLEVDWRRRVTRRNANLQVEVGESSGRVMGGAGVEQGLDRVFESVLNGMVEGSGREMMVRVEETELVLCGAGPGGGIDEETWPMRVARLLIEEAGGSVVYIENPVCARVQLARA